MRSKTSANPFAPVAVVILLTLSSVTEAKSEVRANLALAKNPYVQCSLCESADKGNGRACSKPTVENYCGCRGERDPISRILVRQTSAAPWQAFSTYVTSKVKALEKQLKRKRKSKSYIKKEVAKLKKQLASQQKAYLAECFNPNTTVVGAPITGATPPSQNNSGPCPGSGGPLTFMKSLNGRCLYLLNDGESKHSFALRISEGGAIVGGTYKVDPLPEVGIVDRHWGTGLRISQHGSRPMTPLVWASSGTARACESCTGLVLNALNDKGTAVGNRDTQDPLRARAVTFNYRTKAIGDLPQLPGAGTIAMSINESNVVAGNSQTAAGGQDAVYWKDGIARQVSRSAFTTALDAVLKPLYEAGIKNDMRERQEFSECSNAQIESTRLIGSPTRTAPVSLWSLEVTQAGDILGTFIDPGLRWSYTGTCEVGTYEQFFPVTGNFVMKANLALRVVPSIELVPSLTLLPIGTAVNNLLELFGFGNPPNVGVGNGVRIARINIGRVDSRWTYAPAAPLQQRLIPMGANDLNDVSGAYALTNDDKTMRAFAFIKDTFGDLNTFMDIRPDSEWVLETAIDINNCGQIIGRAYNKVTGANRAFLLSPPACAIPK